MSAASGPLAALLDKGRRRDDDGASTQPGMSYGAVSNVAEAAAEEEPGGPAEEGGGGESGAEGGEGCVRGRSAGWEEDGAVASAAALGTRLGS
jgi:hypothetical protein